MGNSTPCKIVTPKYHLETLHTWLRREVTGHANFGFNRGTVGASPQIGEMLPLCDFFWPSSPVLSWPYLFSRQCAQVEPLDRFSGFMAQTTCFRAGMVLLGVREMDIIFGGRMLPKPRKWAWIGNFKPKGQNMKITVSPKL